MSSSLGRNQWDGLRWDSLLGGSVTIHPLLYELRELQLPKSDYALFGSGPLLVRGWIDEVSDLDVIARGEAWELAQTKGTSERLEEYGIDIIQVGQAITIGTVWAIGQVDVDRLIDDAELLCEIPCVRLEHVVDYKRLADRPKDREHLRLIQTRLAEGER